MPTVNSRPGRKRSTSTGCLKFSSRLLAGARQLVALADDRSGRDALARPLGHRLDEIGRGEGRTAAASPGCSTSDEVGRGDARVAHDALGHALVQGERHDQRVGEGVRDAVGVEQRRHLGLAADAAQALGDVEDEIPAVAAGQPLRQPPDVADAIGRVAEAPDRRLDAVDRSRRGRTRRSLPPRSRAPGIRPGGRRSGRPSCTDVPRPSACASSTLGWVAVAIGRPRSCAAAGRRPPGPTT